MKRHAQVITSLLVGLFLVCGAAAPAASEDEPTGTAKSLVRHLLTPDARMVAEAVALRLHGLSDQDDFGPVEFAVSGARIESIPILGTSDFQLTTVQINHSEAAGRLRKTEGTLVFQDSYGRRLFARYFAAYRIEAADRIVVNGFGAIPKISIRPRVVFFFLPFDAVSIDDLLAPDSHRVMDLIAGKAIPLNVDLRSYRGVRKYLVVAAFTDFIGWSSEVTILKSSSPDGLGGDGSETRFLAAGGFPIAFTTARFSVAEPPEVYFKAVYMLVDAMSGKHYRPTLAGVVSSEAREVPVVLSLPRLIGEEPPPPPVAVRPTDPEPKAGGRAFAKKLRRKESLKILQDLFDAGLITKKEYETKRAAME